MAARVIGTLAGQLQPGVSVDRLNVNAEGRESCSPVCPKVGAFWRPVSYVALVGRSVSRWVIVAITDVEYAVNFAALVTCEEKGK